MKAHEFRCSNWRASNQLEILAQTSKFPGRLKKKVPSDITLIPPLHSPLECSTSRLPYQFLANKSSCLIKSQAARKTQQSPQENRKKRKLEAMPPQPRPRTRAQTQNQQSRHLTLSSPEPPSERPTTASSETFSTSGPARTLLEHAAEESDDDDDDGAPEEMGTLGDMREQGEHRGGEGLERVAAPILKRDEGVNGADVVADEGEGVVDFVSDAGTAAGTETETGDEEAFHTAVEGLESEDRGVGGEEFHTESEEGEGVTEVQGVPAARAGPALTMSDNENGSRSEDEDEDEGDDTLVPDTDEPPRLPMELLKAHNDRESVEPSGENRLEGATNKQRRRMRKNEIRRKKKQWMRLQRDVKGTGVVKAGKAAQKTRGIMPSKSGVSGVKSGRVHKATKPAISGRQRLLEDRKRVASGSGRDTSDYKRMRRT